MIFGKCNNITHSCHDDIKKVIKIVFDNIFNIVKMINI